MSEKERLINQHILEYESRLKHIDELLAEAENKVENTHQDELNEIKNKREELSRYLSSAKTLSIDNWQKDEINMAGPMGVWDVVAQQLEKLVEKIK